MNEIVSLLFLVIILSYCLYLLWKDLIRIISEEIDREKQIKISDDRDIDI